MKFLRYKNLSQFIDTENLYKNLTILSEVFLLTDDYVVFLKNTNGEIFYVKETFAGGFEVIRIPLNTWGVIITEWTLLKCYFFKKIGVRYLTFQINANQYLSILENDAGQSAVFIDSTDDFKTVNLVKSLCPLVSTKEDENQTIHSFNNVNDGTNSSVLYSVNIPQDDQLESNSSMSLNSYISTNQFSELSFNLLINDTVGSSLLFNYDVIDDVIHPYVYDIQSLELALFNQTQTGVEVVKTFNQTELFNYLSMDLSSSLILVIMTNSTLIYYNTSNGKYLYKNILGYFTDDTYTSSEAFSLPELKYNIFKQILFTFNGISDVKQIKISRLILESNMFMKADTNIGIINDVIYKENGLYFEEAQSTIDILVPTNIELTSSITRHNYTLI